MSMNKNAFVIRCAPSGISRVEEMMENNQIVIGWSHMEGLLFDKTMNRNQFKDKIRSVYTDYIDKPLSLGQATGNLWRFYREMNIGDFVLIPIPMAFYLGEITSDVNYLPEMIEKDTSIRRNIRLLNHGEPILRNTCSEGLIKRLKYQGTCVGASDLINDIEILAP